MKLIEHIADLDDELEGEPLLIGLTGGIGSGKSTIAQLFLNNGYPVINVDLEARYIMEQDDKVKQSLIARFGNSIYDEQGNLCSDALSKIVFNSNNYQQLMDLNAIVHPPVLEHVFARAEQLAEEHDMVIIDIALLFESQLQYGFDYVIGVIADREKRTERLMNDRGMRKEDILARIHAQVSDDVIKEQSDFVIENNGTLEQLEKATQYLLEILPYLPNTIADEGNDS